MNLKAICRDCKCEDLAIVAELADEKRLQDEAKVDLKLGHQRDYEEPKP